MLSAQIRNRIYPWGIILILFLTALSYSAAYQVPFIFDDSYWIRANADLQAWSTSFFPPPGTAVSGRPLLTLSLALNYRLGGFAVAGYHLFNLLVHLTSGVLLASLVRTGLRILPEKSPLHQDADLLAVGVAGIWLLHPLQTEAIVYVVQRSESLMGMFYLAAGYFLLRGSQSDQPARYYLPAILAVWLGAATKENIATAPVLFFLFDRFWLGTPTREIWRRRAWVYASMALVWIELAWLFSNAATRGVGADLSYRTLEYVLTSAKTLLIYLKLCFWPAPLIFDYGRDLLNSVREGMLAALAVLVLIGVIARGLWVRRAWAFGALWFLATLAPTTSFIPVSYQPLAEHRLYLPLAGVILGAVLAGYNLGRRYFFIGLIVVMLGCAFMTKLRIHDYRSEVSLWQDTVNKRPTNVRAYVGLGSALAAAGDDQAAVEAYAAGFRISAIYPMLASTLAGAYQRLGKGEMSEQVWRMALQQDPEAEDFKMGLAMSLEAQNHFAEAEQLYRQILQQHPGSIPAATNLALLYLKTQQPERAIVLYGRLVTAQPESAAAQFNLGLALEQAGQWPAAAKAYESAVRLQPGYVEALNNLGGAYLYLGRREDARQAFQAALSLRPDYGKARQNLEAMKKSDGDPGIAHP